MTDIQTSAPAAEALRPAAGDFAFLVYALGVLGTDLLAVRILAVMMVLASRRATTGAHVIGKRLRMLGWLSNSTMALMLCALLATL